MSEKQIKYPQVLLLGNGLNKAFGGSSWDQLINSIWTNDEVALETIHDVPFPLQAVIATKDNIDEKLKEKPDSFYGVKSIDEIKIYIEQLLEMGFDHILTTNYSYEIERVACPSVKRDGEYCRKLMEHTRGCRKAETRYMLHTYNQVPYKKHANKVWYIHGEMRKPQSVILGHYYYGKLLGKYMVELDKRKNKQIKLQKNHKPPIMESWIDAFIMGDVYVLGFGYDFSEMDMWWLLNRKKREDAQHGDVIFYEPSFDKEIKFAMLDVYGAKIKDLGFNGPKINYKEFYKLAIEDIQKHIKQKREEERND